MASVLVALGAHDENPTRCPTSPIPQSQPFPPLTKTVLPVSQTELVVLKMWKLRKILRATEEPDMGPGDKVEDAKDAVAGKYNEATE